MQKNNFCPCCGRHCNLNEPHCERGKAYIRTGNDSGVRHTHHRERDFERYDTLDTDNKLIMNLRDLGHMLHLLYEGKGSQKRILIILLESGNMTQRELTERIGIKPGSVSEVIGKLEKAGLIQRQASAADRRTADIQLTDAGRIQAEEAAQRRKMRHQEMFSCLSEEEKASLLVLMEKLRTDWDSRYGEGVGHHGMHDRHMPHGHHGHRGNIGQ